MVVEWFVVLVGNITFYERPISRYCYWREINYLSRWTFFSPFIFKEFQKFVLVNVENNWVLLKVSKSQKILSILYHIQKGKKIEEQLLVYNINFVRFYRSVNFRSKFSCPHMYKIERNYFLNSTLASKVRQSKK